MPPRSISARWPGPTPIGGPRTVNRWNFAAHWLGFAHGEMRLSIRNGSAAWVRDLKKPQSPDWRNDGAVAQ